MQALLAGIKEIMASHGCEMFGFADLRGLAPKGLSSFDRAISFAIRMDPVVMAGLEHGPTPAYAVLYGQVNLRINALAAELSRELRRAGHEAWPVPASIRSDPVNIKGDFPHKTAATRAGLGWVGRHCQLVTRRYGPWLRLGTVLTGAPFAPGTPVEKSGCGKCMKCVQACPAGALSGAAWQPGLERAVILDAWACDAYKKERFKAFHGGHNCGICTSACPVGMKQLRYV